MQLPIYPQLWNIKIGIKSFFFAFIYIFIFAESKFKTVKENCKKVGINRPLFFLFFISMHFEGNKPFSGYNDQREIKRKRKTNLTFW